MKRASWKIVGALALVASIAGGAPAQAGTVGTGDLAFVADVDLDAFPCKAPLPGQFPCHGSISGTVAGEMNGVHRVPGADRPWALELADPEFNASFLYFDQVEPGALCGEAFSAGTGNISADVAEQEALGVYGNQLPVAGAIVGAQASFGFEYRRVGVTAVIRTYDWNVTVTALINGVPTDFDVVADGDGVASAALAAETTQEHREACLNDENGPPIHATLIGGGDMRIVSP